MSLPPIFLLIAGLTLSSIFIDTLHTCDLGVTAHIVANIFIIVAQKRRGGRIEQRVEAIGEELERWCKDRKAKSGLQGKLTHQRCRSQSGFPKLKAKGAAVRCILRFALELARRERLDDRVIGVAQLMERFYEIIYSQSLIMAQDAIDRLEQTGSLLCNIYIRGWRQRHFLEG